MHVRQFHDPGLRMVDVLTELEADYLPGLGLQVHAPPTFGAAQGGREHRSGFSSIGATKLSLEVRQRNT